MKHVVFLFGLALGSAAQADIVLPNGKVIECFCTDSGGDRVELGQSICLYVDGRAFKARCEMSLNNPIWRETGESCTTSLLDRIQRLQPLADPAAVDAKI